MTIRIQNFLKTKTHNPFIKRTIQDSVFTNLFKEKKYLIQLYQALHPEDTTTTEDDIMYLMQTYNEYFRTQRVSLYSSKKVKIPKPELYVIFTGERCEKTEYISLSEEFFDGQDCAVDAKVKMIYNSEEGDIINQYISPIFI